MEHLNMEIGIFVRYCITNSFDF